MKPAHGVELPSQIAFENADMVERHLALAHNNLHNLSSDLNMDPLHFKTFGKGFIKRQKCSPDSFLQIAFQVGLAGRLKSVDSSRMRLTPFTIESSDLSESIDSLVESRLQSTDLTADSKNSSRLTHFCKPYRVVTSNKVVPSLRREGCCCGVESQTDLVRHSRDQRAPCAVNFHW